ncbi:hypothetical protein BS17DRAFT_839514 [Gyrodon lividus]|nr:hypothetical protein BS17DRAFT_839514 [Gyrodon lividus]
MNTCDGTILSEHQYDSVIGCVAISQKKELVVIDNTINGFTLYPLDNATLIRNFVTNPPLVPLPKQVAFREDSRLIVGGSDNGSVYLFDRRSDDGLVQTIAFALKVWATSLTQRWCGDLVMPQSSIHVPQPLFHEASTTDLKALRELVIQLADLARDVHEDKVLNNLDAKCGRPEGCQKFDTGFIESTVEKTGTFKDTIIYL